MSEAEILELRKELRLLQAQVSQLQLRVSELEGFEVVSQAGGYSPPTGQPAAPTTSSEAPASSSAFASVSEPPLAAPTEESPEEQSWEFRLQVAREIGSFLRLSLEGVNQGRSGRHKISLKSRLYIVIKDRAGNVYTNPVKIIRTWRDTKAIVERDGDLGDSVFVGVPSEKEGRVAVLEAGFHWPALEN